MVINGHCLLEAAPIKDMARQKINEHGVSYGLGEAGYDIRLKQEIEFLPTHQYPNFSGPMVRRTTYDGENTTVHPGRFVIASAIEEFQMPDDMVAIVHDKSTWARQGLSVFNTVIEPGWQGFLTLELVYHGSIGLRIPAGAGIAQVLFHRVVEPRAYTGKYQNQENKPVGSRFFEPVKRILGYIGAGDLDAGSPNHTGPGKRGWSPN